MRNITFNDQTTGDPSVLFTARNVEDEHNLDAI